MLPLGHYYTFDLLGNQDSIVLAVLDVPDAMFGRGMVRSRDCVVDITYDESALYGTPGDRVIIILNDYYKGNVEGLCGDFNENPHNDNQFCDTPSCTEGEEIFDWKPTGCDVVMLGVGGYGNNI